MRRPKSGDVICRSAAAKALAGAWDDLPATSQQRLIAAFVLMASQDGADACRRAARKALQKLPLTQQHLQPLLQPLADIDPAATDGSSAPRAKHHRSSRSAAPSSAMDPDAEAQPHLSAALASATAALEVLTWRHDAIADAHALVPTLQQCLATCTSAAGTAPGAAYVTRLTLSALAALAPAALAESADEEGTPGAAIGTVVAALERADSAETAAAALGVLTALAAARPREVLASVTAAVELSGAQFEKVLLSVVVDLMPL